MVLRANKGKALNAHMLKAQFRGPWYRAETQGLCPPGRSWGRNEKPQTKPTLEDLSALACQPYLPWEFMANSQHLQGGRPNSILLVLCNLNSVTVTKCTRVCRASVCLVEAKANPFWKNASLIQTSKQSHVQYTNECNSVKSKALKHTR